MESLPEEVLAMLLPHIGGCDFIHLRRVNWRFKKLCDREELANPSSLWNIYLHRDFPGPCIQSVRQTYCRNGLCEISPKRLYVVLYGVQFLKQNHNTKCVITKLSTENVNVNFISNLFNNITFIGDRLFITEHSAQLCGVIDRDIYEVCDWERHVSEISTSQETFREKQVDFILFVIGDTYTEEEMHVFLKQNKIPVHLVDNLSYTDSDKVGIDNMLYFPEKLSHHLLQLGFSEEYKQIIVNETQVVILLKQQIFVYECNFPEFTQTCNISSCAAQLRTRASKIGMLGDLMVVLMCDGRLEFANIIGKGSPAGIQVTDFKPLTIHPDSPPTGLVQHKVVDFLFYGCVFAAVADSGQVYLSVLDRCDADSLLQNLLPPQRITEAPYIPKVVSMCATTDRMGRLLLAFLEAYRRDNPYLTYGCNVYLLSMLPDL